jgi:hypothetical protein
MRARHLMLIIVTILFSGPARSQGNDATTPGAQSESAAERGEVQIGAGSTAAVTTGSSGPSGAKNPTVPGGAAPFDITPQQDAFLGPRMLPITPPKALRCDLIADANAQRRCRGVTRETAGGAGG